MMKTTEIHSEALNLLKRINNEIPDKNRVETLNIMMKGVVNELNGALYDEIVPKPEDHDTK
jgi:hypothetical protein